jgi:hypothetical protein
MMHGVLRVVGGLLLLSAGICVSIEPVEAGRARDALDRILRDLDPAAIPSGILYDRVLSLSDVGDHDGSEGATPATLQGWRQMYHEIRGASLEAPSWPELSAILASGKTALGRGVVPVVIMNFEYERIRPGALTDGALTVAGDRLVLGPGEAFVHRRVFAAAALQGYTHRGGNVTFVLGRDWYFSNDLTAPRAVSVDFGDGVGPRGVDFGREIAVSYVTTGRKTIHVELSLADGSVLHGGFYYDVVALAAPAPHDTLQIVASIPYLGEFGTGEAYVYLSDLNPALTNPIVVVEGFDFDDAMGWEELYAILNEQNMLETIRGLGYDIVALNFTHATDYLQRNAFVLVELLEQVNAIIDPGQDIALAGASMGGVVSRYALTYMEVNALDPNLRVYISFDAPQRGANIPLGIQYWLAFFADDSADAARLLAALDSPGARQLLAYHHTDPPGATGESDPLRGDFVAEMASLGDYPTGMRKVSIVNGSGSQADQGYPAGDQIIEWEYSNILIDIIGNIWSVPDGTSQTIFHGLIDPIFFPADEQIVAVGATSPYDTAPGGFRPSMAQMDTVPAPYGDIVALHDNHCFIPTVSALDLDTADLFYDVAGDPDIYAHTPFDAVYFPVENQEHASITAENAAWFIDEVLMGVTAVEPPSGVAALPAILSVAPNPLGMAGEIRFALARAGTARLAAFDLAGREVTVLADGAFQAGVARVGWDGTAAGGRRVAPGVYFLRLQSGGGAASWKVLLR